LDAWVAVDNAGGLTGRLFHSTNVAGQDWTPVEAPSARATSLLTAQVGSGTDLFLGTANSGILECQNCDPSHPVWTEFGSGLPHTWVSALSCTADHQNLV